MARSVRHGRLEQLIAIAFFTSKEQRPSVQHAFIPFIFFIKPVSK